VITVTRLDAAALRKRNRTLVDDWEDEEMAVEDPFENNFNVARAIDDDKLVLIQREFRKEYLRVLGVRQQPSQ
jgi:hypothetical protein